MIDWELIGFGVLLMFMIFIGQRLSLRAFLRYLRETHVEIEESSKRTRAKIQKSGEDARASMRDLSQLITRSRLATKEELIGMLDTLK